MQNAARKRLLVADNSPDYLSNLVALLELEGYAVDQATSAKEALAKLAAGRFDLAVLDKRLTKESDSSDLSGLEVAKAASEMGIPCVVNTAYRDIESTRTALCFRQPRPWAIDVLAKGDDRGLVAVISGALHSTAPARQITDLTIDLARRIVERNGRPVKLSDGQYRLLAHLYQHANALCTARELIKAVYDEDIPAGQTSADKRLERLVARLRLKIEDNPDAPQRLITEPGRGYRLVP